MIHASKLRCFLSQTYRFEGRGFCLGRRTMLLNKPRWAVFAAETEPCEYKIFKQQKISFPTVHKIFTPLFSVIALCVSGYALVWGGFRGSSSNFLFKN
jgi:hypothetical protein